MKKFLYSLFSAILIFSTLISLSVFAAIGDGEYARYIASMENTDNNVPLNFIVWDAVKMPVEWKLQTAVKDPLSGSNAMKISCSNNEYKGGDFHATAFWMLSNEYSNWQGAQYLEFWIKNDTGYNFALQVQLIEYDKNNQPAGEPWRTKVKTEVLYEENGAFVKRTSDVSSAETYNEYAQEKEGAIAIPKNYTGRIRIAINTNNFYRALWFSPMTGDGSNNTIDKDKFAQLSFNYDPRTVESNSTWYLDSIKLVAPNANLYKGVSYSKLDVKNETNAATQSTSTVASTSSTLQSSSSVSSEIVSAASNNSQGTSSITNDTTKPTDNKNNNGVPVGVVVAIVVAFLIILAGGGAVVFMLFKAKKGV